MLLRAYWPDCRFRNWEWQETDLDSFWVECTLQEAKTEAIPRLTGGKQSEGSLERELSRCEDPSMVAAVCDMYKGNPDAVDSAMLFFLVARDLGSVLPMPWHYPVANLWNGYSPFREIESVSIVSLAELSNVVPREKPS